MIAKKKLNNYYLDFLKLKLKYFILLFLFIFILYYCDNKQNFYSKKRLIWKKSKKNIKKIKEEIKQYNKKFITYNEIKYTPKIKNPKISLIIPVLNQEKYLIPLYKAIQKQSLKEIEIIFVDDASTDNSRNIIKKINEKDKRISYIKNKINKRTFYSRKIGVFYSKGEYILIIDPDDLLLNNILEKLYETAKLYKLDILQYYIIIGNIDNNKVWEMMKCKRGIIYYPLTLYIFCYCLTRNLCDKLIKREIFIKSVIFMGENYNFDRFEIHDDDTAFYGLINVAKSFGFLEEIGYFYNINNSNSSTHQIFKPKNINKIIRSLFVIMKYYFEKSKNDRFHKKYIPYQFFFSKVFTPYRDKIKYLSRGFKFINDVFNQFLNCQYFNEEEKKNLILLKNEINHIRNKKYK